MTLKPGTLCVIVGGCPANIGIVVEVVAHLGAVRERDDAYEVRTVSGRPFAQLWGGRGANRYLRSDNKSNYCITDRHKLRPLVDPKGKERTDATTRVEGRKRDLATSE